MTYAPVFHRRLDVGGVEVFYRESGPKDAPVVLLPHGYPCSSYEFRNYMAALGDRWRLLAPDFPGCGYSATPEDFDYTFDGYARFLERFADRLGLRQFVIYLHDFGSQIGLRLAIRKPEMIAGCIIQNGDIYEDVLGPKYAMLKSIWNDPPDEGYRKILDAITRDEFREEFLNDVGDTDFGTLIPPDLWELHWAQTTDQRREIYAAVIAGLKENLAWFPRYQAYLRDHQPPTLIAWGPNDGYMPAESAHAYLRDLPNAELHLLGGGHWLLETHLNEVVDLTRGFLGRVHR
jgi:pimeloyl-ACP methyl ester carboxylesterase